MRPALELLDSVEELQRALLTDEELAGGEEAWKQLVDPFFGGVCFSAVSKASKVEMEEEVKKRQNPSSARICFDPPGS